MKKILSLILIITVPLFTLTGCYTQFGIDKFYYIVALGIDSQENNLLKISIQTATSSVSAETSDSSGSSQSSNYKIYSVEAETIDSGITILNNYLNKKINLSHCSALVLSEDLARNDVTPYINALNNNTELRHSCRLLISSSTAYDVLDKVSNSGEVFSSRLYDYLTNSTSYTGFSIKSTFGNFFQDLEDTHRQPAAIYTKINNDTIQNFGIAIFKEGKMIGNLDALDTISHLIVTNELNTCILTIPNPFEEKGKVDLDIKLYKNTKISINVINNSPFIEVDIYPEGMIRTSGSKFDYTTSQNIYKFEESTNNYIENIINDYVYKVTKEYNSDISGFAAKYSSYFLTEKEFNEAHWNEIFKDSYFKIKVHTRINSSNLFNKQ